MWELTQYRISEIYLDMTIPEIIEQVLNEAGFQPGDYEISLKDPSSYRRWSFICQYQETHFDFISRRMEHEGIYYFFEQTQDGEKLIITNHEIVHVDLADQNEIHYSPPSGLNPQVQSDAATAFITRQKPLPAKVVLQDFNYRKSRPIIQGEATVSDNGKGEVYIYGEHVKDADDANKYAAIRAEEILCRHRVYHGESTAPFLRTGYHFELTDHYRDDCNQKYLLTDIHHEGSQAALFLSGDGLKLSGEEQRSYYRNSFEAIPAGVQFRPERITPKPRFYGTINAKVAAEGDGQYAELDEFGRYKVKIPFDRSDRQGKNASRWIRMAQPYQGPDEGMHFPLRNGHGAYAPDDGILWRAL